MFIKVKDYIINTAHITYVEWRTINAGSPSETHNLILHFAISATTSCLTLREDEEVQKLRRYLDEQCEAI